MHPEWWHWAVVGIVLVLAELAVPAFVLVWFGLGAVLVAAIVFVLPGAGLTFQIATWTLASLAMVLLWFKIFKPGFHKTRIGMADANVIGEVGVLIQDVEPYRKGQVRFQKPILGADVWDCIADEAIGSGERIKVLGVEGSLLKVGRA
jgi:membrane protein implicated in regulation of membrane protease activity